MAEHSREPHRIVEDTPQRRTPKPLTIISGVLVVLLLIAIVLLATGVIKMNPLGGP